MSLTTLYRFFDSSDRLLYVGIAGNPGRRFDQHAKEKYRFSTADLSTASLIREFADDMMAKVPAVDLRPFYALMVIAPAALTDAA